MGFKSSKNNFNQPLKVLKTIFHRPRKSRKSKVFVSLEIHKILASHSLKVIRQFFESLPNIVDTYIRDLENCMDIF